MYTYINKIMLKSNWNHKCSLSNSIKAALTTSSDYLPHRDPQRRTSALPDNQIPWMTNLTPSLRAVYLFLFIDDDEASQCCDSTDYWSEFPPIVSLLSVRWETLLNVSKQRLRCPAVQQEPIRLKRFAVPFVNTEKKAFGQPHMLIWSSDKKWLHTFTSLAHTILQKRNILCQLAKQLFYPLFNLIQSSSVIQSSCMKKKILNWCLFVFGQQGCSDFMLCICILDFALLISRQKNAALIVRRAFCALITWQSDRSLDIIASVHTWITGGWVSGVAKTHAHWLYPELTSKKRQLHTSHQAFPQPPSTVHTPFQDLCHPVESIITCSLHTNSNTNIYKQWNTNITQHTSMLQDEDECIWLHRRN